MKCLAFKKDGKQCNSLVKTNGFCGTHARFNKSVEKTPEKIFGTNRN